MINKKSIFRKNRWDHLLLKGNKVIIRSLRRDDIDKRLAWKKYPDPLYFHYNPPNFGQKEREEWYFKRKYDPNMVYLAIDNHQDRLVGFICLYKIDRSAKTAWTGIFLGYEFTDRGYGTDAILTLAKYFFEEMERDHLYIIGPGTTTQAIVDYVGLKKTLLGVDVLYDQNLIAVDANEERILYLINEKKSKIVL